MLHREGKAQSGKQLLKPETVRYMRDDRLRDACGWTKEFRSGDGMFFRGVSKDEDGEWTKKATVFDADPGGDDENAVIQARWNDLGEWQEFKVFSSSGDDEVLCHGHSVHIDAHQDRCIIRQPDGDELEAADKNISEDCRLTFNIQKLEGDGDLCSNDKILLLVDGLFHYTHTRHPEYHHWVSGELDWLRESDDPDERLDRLARLVLVERILGLRRSVVENCAAPRHLRPERRKRRDAADEHPEVAVGHVDHRCHGDDWRWHG